MKHPSLQWHPAFVAAMNLELKANRADLDFQKEYNLNTKPLEIDLLVIKKHPGIRVENEIGRIFRGHNIMEYKSPGDSLDIDVFYKAQAYAALYKSYGTTVDKIKAEDVTVTLLREAGPAGLFRHLREHGCEVSNPWPGIYYIAGTVLFPTQIVVTGELDKTSHIWLASLSADLNRQDMAGLLGQLTLLHDRYDQELADSVLKISIGANKEIVKELLGDERMYQALLEIMEPQLLLREKEAEKRGLEIGEQRGFEIGERRGLGIGIQGTVAARREFGQTDDEIKAAIMKTYRLSEAEADEYL